MQRFATSEELLYDLGLGKYRNGWMIELLKLMDKIDTMGRKIDDIKDRLRKIRWTVKKVY